MASTINAIETGLYLYGITTAEGALPVRVSGVAGGSVERVVEGPVAAIVTRVAVQKMRPQRSNLAAHNQIIRDLADRQSVLPVAFGTIVDDEEGLRRVIRRNRESLIARLRLLQNKVEMILKVFWDTPNIFEYFVATHKELQQMRNRLFGGGRKPSRSQSIELGELFASLLQQTRERHAGRLTKALFHYCADIHAIDVGEEKLIVKLACLVEKDRVKRWEEGVKKAACEFDNNYCFKYGNPSLPYNFADVDLELEERL
ncbi:MAG: GvpL/GvpF family gas vesicle protein [Planctomycetes bacterium]|nr:GvpL/GvpF family gas vesicle protein [Planctomycetota bacterium]MBU4400758.1 GvpL/GvpF family gas vesicle protein [Planctomycetota bacterium]MCG2684114.1 GvpL/GvpF family gas vesicle protein [Planctomycetales bacterium]